ncbi:hypothetical protein Tcan_15306 [Toxocara canis]|uniref:Uncharacterized protein n=1 Tax=Toxocara canis TaxID=6265 RepID=A0A0B2VXI0_TOXCA|nr:hypothetical protein Tcan_15306 [Toxocara canis]
MITNECGDSDFDDGNSKGIGGDVAGTMCNWTEVIVDRKRSQKRRYSTADESKPQKIFSPHDHKTSITTNSESAFISRATEEDKGCCNEITSNSMKTPEKRGHPPPPANQPDFMSAPRRYRYVSRLCDTSSNIGDQEQLFAGVRRKLLFDEP